MSINPEISYSPAQIAEAIGQYRPNPDQEKVICAPVDKPMMAIAGAGAGKTATGFPGGIPGGKCFGVC